MSEAARRDDAFQSALERLPVAVVVVDGQQRLQPYNSRAADLFRREGLVGDLLSTRPAHPVSVIVREILGGKSQGERTVTFPSGVTYRIAPSSASPKGVGRWLMLLVSPLPARDVTSLLAAFDLTPREHDVARLLVIGKTTEDICNELGISRETLKTHLGHLFDKAGARTRTEFVARVLGTV